MKPIHRILVAAALGAVFTGARANSYTVVDLGRHDEPQQVNAHGDIAGRIDGAGLLRQPIVWRGGHWHDLPADGQPGWAAALNDHGDVAGAVGDSPVVWPRGGGRRWVVLPDGAARGAAYGIAADGAVVGGYASAGGRSRCFMSGRDHVARDMGTMGRGDYCIATAVNVRHQVAGWAQYNRLGSLRGFIWSRGRFRNLGVLPGGASSFANAVNCRGQVVGGSDVAGGRVHAFAWKRGTMDDIGASSRFASTEALAISDAGEIVGFGTLPAGAPSPSHAVRFDRGEVIALEDEVTNLGGWRLQEAFGVNRRGVIVGWGHLGLHRHGFMLIPNPSGDER